MKNLKRLFTPPVFEDELMTQQAYLLNVIIWTLICVPIPFVVYALVKTPENISRVYAQAVFGETVNIILLIILRRGFVRVASIIQVSAFWLFFTATAITGSGVQGEAYLLGYGLVIAVAGILLGGMGALIFTCFSLAAGGLMVYEQVQEAISSGFESSPLTTWFVSLVLFPVGAVLQYLAARATRSALTRARASEERYRLISRVGSDYTFSTEIDSAGNLRPSWMAGAFKEITGYSFEEYVESGGWLAHLHPDDVEKDTRDLAILKKGQSINSEMRTYKRDGSLRWVQVSAHPVWDDKQNRLIGIVGAVRNITERKQAEEALRKSEAIYRQAIEVAGGVPYHQIFDENGNIHYTFMSEGIRQITGYGPEEFNDALWGSLIQERHLLDDLAEYSLEDAIQNVRSGKNRIWKCEHRIKTRDGKIRWIFEAAVDLRDERGIAYGSIGLYQDITERKQTEEALRKSEAIYRQAIEVAGAVPYHQTYTADDKVVYDFVGEGIRQITGYGPEEFNEHLWDSLTQDRHLLEDLAEYSIDEAIQKVRSGKNPIWKCEHHIQARDGKAHWVFEAAVELRDEHGTSHGSVGLFQDITERKQSEDALRYERDLLQIFMDNIPDSVYFKDTESRFVRINKAQAQFLNLNDPQDAIGKTDLDFQYPELAQQFLEEEKQIIETGQAVINRIEYNPTADEKPRWLSATKVLAKDSSGHAIGTIGVSRDITQQKEAQENLQRIFLQQAAILNNIPDMAWLKDKDSRYIAVNEQFAKRVGKLAKDIIGKTDPEVWQNRYAESYRQDDLEVMQTRQRRNAEELEIDNMGNEYWVETSKTPILNADGEVIGTTGIAREITERKKTEKAELARREMLEKVIRLGKQVTEVNDLKTTLEKIWHGIHDDLGFDRPAIFLYDQENYSVKGTLGTNLQGEIADESDYSQSLHNEKPASFTIALAQPDGLYFTPNYGSKHNIPEGHEMHAVRDYAAVTAWGGDKPVAIIAVDNVVSQRPMTKEQLEALHLFAGYAGLAIENARLNTALEDDLHRRASLIEELEKKNAELERFTYTVSHDLKSPLVTITGFLGYLEKDALAGNIEKVKSNANRISSAARKMQALLNDLLELSRIGRLMNSPEDVPFEEIVHEAVDRVHGKLDEINAIVEIQTDLPVVNGDRTRLVEVVQNLIDNAAKYSNPESRSRIEVGTITDKQGQTAFYVRDNGIGIAPKYHENIFGLFNKLNAASEGTGIGLTLVKRIIEVHGGHIWVESEAGEGATFFFTLPIRQIKE